MRSKGLSKLVGVFSVITVVVAVAAFLGGMYISRTGSLESSSGMKTLTMPQMITVTQVVTQAVTPAQITSPTISPSIQLPSKIVIGVTLALSGSQADGGRRGLWGIMTGVKWVNEVYGGVHLYGKAIPIEIKYYDDESKKENTVSYTERLITVDKVNFLLSAYTGPLVFAQAPIAEKYKMLLVDWGGASDSIYEQGYKYVVGVLTPQSKFMLPALYALKSIDPNAKVAILYKDDETNRVVGSSVSAKAKELGFKVVYEKVYPADINDFSPYISDLARSGADALIVSPHIADGRLFTKQLSDAGVNFKFIAMRLAACLPEYYDSFKTLAEGIACPSLWEPGLRFTPDLAKSLGMEWFGPTTEEFVQLFRNVTGDPKIQLSYQSAMGAAGVLVLVKAIETAQSLDPTAVREAFNRLSIMTFFGPFKIDPATGKQIAKENVLGQWQSGRFVVVWPPEVAQAKLYYPIPTWDEKRSGKVASY